MGSLQLYRTAPVAVARSPLAFSSKVADLGEVAPGDAVEQTLWLENPSSFPVWIEAVMHSCGCTTTRAASLVPAKGRVPFTVRLIAERRLGNERQEARVYVKGHPEPLTLSILAHVVARPSRPIVKVGTAKDDGDPLPCTVGGTPTLILP